MENACLINLFLQIQIPKTYVEIKCLKKNQQDEATKPKMFEYHSKPRYEFIQMKWTCL